MRSDGALSLRPHGAGFATHGAGLAPDEVASRTRSSILRRSAGAPSQADAGRADPQRPDEWTDAGERASGEGLLRALALNEAAGDVIGWCDSLDELALVCASRGHPDLAVRLWAAAATNRADAGGVRTAPADQAIDPALTSARRSLGDAAETIWREGRQLGLREASAFAARNRGKRGRPSTGWQSLTPAELAVVRLVCEHLSNPQIADRLFVSRATVKTRLVHIFGKIGVSSRSELAALALERRLTAPTEEA